MTQTVPLVSARMRFSKNAGTAARPPASAIPAAWRTTHESYVRGARRRRQPPACAHRRRKTRPDETASARCRRSPQTAAVGANRPLVELGAGPGRSNSVRDTAGSPGWSAPKPTVAAGPSLATNGRKAIAKASPVISRTRSRLGTSSHHQEGENTGDLSDAGPRQQRPARPLEDPRAPHARETTELPSRSATKGTLAAGIHAAPMMARPSGAEARQPVRRAHQI